MFTSVAIAARLTPKAVVLGVFDDKKLDTQTKKDYPEAAEAIGRDECTGEACSIVETFTEEDKPVRLLIVGLGNRDNFTHNTLRNVAGAIGRRLARTKESAVAVDLWSAIKSNRKLDATMCGRAFGEGLGLLAWNFDTFQGSATTKKTPGKLRINAPDADFNDGMKVGMALAESTNVSRSLSETPPNIATTTYIVQQAKALARKFPNLSCKVIQGDQLEKEGLEGLINVGKASENQPCLIRLEYKPSKAKARTKPVVFVGKTITYDSGGLSLKISGSMRGMKHDKNGGCAVIGAMHAIASTIKPNVPVVALLACAENSVSDEAYRPDDIITFRNGVTVEVTNTDAEGRLVLADALCWACDKENPACIVDMATLTGGIVVALGNTYAGMWCEDNDLRAKLEAAADNTGDRLWRLPHHQEYNDLMRSSVADVLNSAPVRAAHPIQGAAFLSYFVADGIPWAHIDIAGTSVSDKDNGCMIKGPTGFGVRLLADLLDQY